MINLKKKSVYLDFVKVLKQNPIIVIFFVFFVIFSFLYTRKFLSTMNLQAILGQFVTLMLFALGPSIVMVIGELDLSYVGIWMLGGIIVWMLTPVLGLFSILVFPLLGLVTGTFIGFVHTKTKIPVFILTLSLLVTYWGLTSQLSGGYPRATEKFGFITADIIPYIPTVLFWTIPLIIFAIYLMKFTKIGTYLYAIGSNEEGAKLAGINVKKYKMLAFVISGIFTGLSTIILFQHLGGSVPVELNLDTMVNPLVAIVLGGTPLTGGSGGPHKTIFGALTFSVITRGLNISALHPTTIQLFIGILLIIAIVISARGMKGVEVT
ncbi:MAG: ABC transporter permease [Halanaerobiales bacterium]|nr:ABC transporter permease [Halanaerobiales bacterium]